MKPMQKSRLRARIGHPIIDADGHFVECVPLLLDKLRELSGADAAAAVKREIFEGKLRHATPAERKYHRMFQGTWGLQYSEKTIDWATGLLPRLLYDRLDEIGFDVTVLFPSTGFALPRLADAALRQASCRALNSYTAEAFAEFGDRIIPAALIPMGAPEEALAELEFAVGTLGMKVVVVSGFAPRPVPAIRDAAPDIAPLAPWLDFFCYESEFDYDPVWRRCIELRVPVMTHEPGFGWGSRRSISNFMFNHIGHFAAAHEALCKSMVFGGVPHRFPDLRVGFLEGGVGWAVGLYCDLLSHWKKRNKSVIHEYDPRRVDRAMIQELCEQYGAPIKTSRSLDEITQFIAAGTSEPARDPKLLDEFADSGISGPNDIRDMFARNFFFGCEGDDPIVAHAFNTKVNPKGLRLNAIYSSDIGHWDVTDIGAALEEPYELIEHGLIGAEDFRAFTFTNAVNLFAGANPDFFKETVISSQVASVTGGRP